MRITQAMFTVCTVLLFSPLASRDSVQLNATGTPESCLCKQIQILQIELRNAQTLRNAFAKKISDLRRLGNDSSQIELRRFAGREARTGLIAVPGYNGPDEVDYVPHGNNVAESRLDVFSAEELCRLESSAAAQLDAAVNASACFGIGEALRAHEDVHKRRCLRTGYRSYLGMHGADRAQEEVEAYDAQISKLKQTLDDAIKTCRFNLQFDSEIERRQGSARELGRVRATVDIKAASLKDDVLELAAAETALEYLEYSWTDDSDCANSGRGSGGRFRMTNGQITLKPPDGPPRFAMSTISLTIDPGQTSEVHTVRCKGMTMNFPGHYWSAAFTQLHGGRAGFTVSDWTIEHGAQARRVFENTRECNKAMCKERTTILLHQQSESPAVASRRFSPLLNSWNP